MNQQHDQNSEKKRDEDQKDIRSENSQQSSGMEKDEQNDNQ